MAFRNVLITGANRGIGLELVKQITQTQQATNVFAACRKPDAAESLQALKASSSGTAVHILKLDVCDESQINAVADYVKEKVQQDGLNVLVNNAGFLDKVSFPSINADAMQKHFLVNCTGPLLMVEKFLPLLKTAASKDTSGAMTCSKAAIINISTALGSIENATVSPPGFLPYCTSKAALNMAMRHVALNVKKQKILVVNLNPGWVKTDMGGDQAPIKVEDCVSNLLKLMSQLDKSHHGYLVHLNGSKIPF